MSRLPGVPRSLDIRPVTTARSGATPNQDQVQSPLVSILPTFLEPLTGGFTEINVPNGTDCSGAAAWYPLIDVDVSQAYGQDVMLFSADVDQLSPDVVGEATVYLPWGQNDPLSGGNGTGNGAWIVIGTNLPISGANGWVASYAPLPSTNQTGVPLLVQSTRPQYILSRPFPCGSYGTSSQVRRTVTKNWAPYAYRFPLGSRIQAALVVLGSQIENTSGFDVPIRGGAHVQLWLGQARNTTTLGTVR
jgi:hypothetical protein